MKRLIDRWNAYWFPTTTTLNLALCRIIAVGAQMFWFFPPLDFQLHLLQENPQFVAAQPFIRAITAIVPRDVFFTRPILTTLYWASMLAGLSALFGFFTRTSMFLFALGTWFFISHGYSYADVHHPEALFAIFLMALAFSPSGQSLSVDALLRRARSRRANRPITPERADTAMWPLKLAHVLLALTYFSTGISKLLSGGLAWMNGYTLQFYTFRDGISTNRPLGIWLGQQHTLCVWLSVFTILFELFFFVSLILPRTAPFFFIGAIFFHIGLFLTGGHPFFQHILLNAMLLVFLDPDRFPAFLHKVGTHFSRWRGQEQAQEA